MQGCVTKHSDTYATSIGQTGADCRMRFIKSVQPDVAYPPPRRNENPASHLNSKSRTFTVPSLTMASLFKIPSPIGVSRATAKQQMLKQLVCSDAPEQALRYHGFRIIAGVDEVGRGALFGPVVAAAVILPQKTGILARMGLKDSKQLDRTRREKLDKMCIRDRRRGGR